MPGEKGRATIRTTSANIAVKVARQEGLERRSLTKAAESRRAGRTSRRRQPKRFDLCRLQRCGTPNVRFNRSE